MTQISRTTLERIKWACYLTVPVWFGYWLARDEDRLEAVRYWFPSVAGDRQGAHGRQLPTLADEYKAMALEAALDAALAEQRARKQKAVSKDA